jgi:hypothetical protein
MIYCINVILDRMDYSDVLGYIVSYFYVANVVSRPQAIARMTIADYDELREVCDVMM